MQRSNANVLAGLLGKSQAANNALHVENANLRSACEAALKLARRAALQEDCQADHDTLIIDLCEALGIEPTNEETYLAARAKSDRGGT